MESYPVYHIYQSSKEITSKEELENAEMIIEYGDKTEISVKSSEKFLYLLFWSDTEHYNEQTLEYAYVNVGNNSYSYDEGNLLYAEGGSKYYLIPILTEDDNPQDIDIDICFYIMWET